MDEQLLRLQASTDLTEDLFNGLRDATYDIDATFGHDPEHQHLSWPGDVDIPNENTLQFYEMNAYAGTSGLGMRRAGLAFSLSQLTITQLEPGRALRYVRENVPQGSELVTSLASEKQTNMGSADRALLFVLWEYGVNSFYPDVARRNEVRLITVAGDETQEVLHHISTLRAIRTGMAHFWRSRRRARVEQNELQAQYTAAHIEYILGKLSLPNLRAA
ncbi:MAG TPA: hypothetical protein VJR27_03840 [Candidatus Saccharimonadales bacterium]|nr:hypothetical protein [Candidatus Saccharimonadales bacterium]